MEQIDIYLASLAICVAVGFLFNKSSIPTPLILVIAGMILGFIPNIPNVTIHSDFILNVFLPLLVYSASTNFSWPDVKLNLRPILLLSIGHVVFIGGLVALVIHTLIPKFGWPMSFILGAVIAPPDDVAILAIADKVKMPARVVTILKGESLLNDATALILFRFSLAALITHEFSPIHAVSAFFLVVVGETAYGFILGHLIGKLRLKMHDPMLQIMTSIITPFIAYLPAERLGGCGVLATVITGFVIGHFYIEKYPPDIRLQNRTVWACISYTLQSIVFLLVGLNFHLTLHGIAHIPMQSLALYSGLVILTVIIGRFVWVFPAAYIPRLLFAAIREKDPYPPWQLPFIISWAGMRGVISLAAALAVPTLPIMIEGTNPKDLLIFLVFTVIMATLLLQGMTLPWIIRLLRLNIYGQHEIYHDHLTELSAREQIAKRVLHWLKEYQHEVNSNELLLEKVKLRIQEYQLRSRHLQEAIKNHTEEAAHDETREERETNYLSTQINELERVELLKLWHENKITYNIRNKILQQLDHRSKHIAG